MIILIIKIIIGWTREGDTEHLRSGLAVIMTNRGEGEKTMYIGLEHVGENFIDVIGNCDEEVIIREDGCGVFKVKAKSVSVWVRK